MPGGKEAAVEFGRHPKAIHSLHAFDEWLLGADHCFYVLRHLKVVLEEFEEAFQVCCTFCRDLEEDIVY